MDGDKAQRREAGKGSKAANLCSCPCSGPAPGSARPRCLATSWRQSLPAIPQPTHDLLRWQGQASGLGGAEGAGGL